MKVLSREDILDILYGGAILGTGGGGSLTKGLVSIDLAISKGKHLRLPPLTSLMRMISLSARTPAVRYHP